MIVPRIKGKRVYVLPPSVGHLLRLEDQLGDRHRRAALFGPFNKRVLYGSRGGVAFILELHRESKPDTFSFGAFLECMSQEDAVFDLVQAGSGSLKKG